MAPMSSTEESIDRFLKIALISPKRELILKGQTTMDEMKSLTEMMDVGDAGVIDYEKAQITTSDGKPTIFLVMRMCLQNRLT